MQIRKSIKFLSFAALLAGALVSCEVLPEPLKLSEDGIWFHVSDIATKTTEVTTATLASSGFNVSATSGTAGSEVEIFTNVAFSQNAGVFSGGQFWPVDEPAGGVHFYASNAGLVYNAAGARVSALNTTDVVCAYLPDPDFGEENELTFSHIFARLDTVKVVAETGYTISNVSIRVTPKTAGTYDLRAGAGHADGTGWSSVVTGSETAVATAVGSNVLDLYMVPGTYTVKVSWTATKGGSVENFTDETVDFNLEAGKRSEVTFTLGGNAADMKFGIAVTPWAVTAISPAGHDLSQPLTFEIISDGTVVWKCLNASVSKTLYYRKNGGEWTELTTTTSGFSIDVLEGDVLEFYGTNKAYGSSSYYNYVTGTADFYIYGNLNSLVDYCTDFSLDYGSYAYCFRRLFEGNTKLHSHPSKSLYLPSRTLVRDCYYNLFSRCTGLTSPPIILAEFMHNSASTCCYGMFESCTGLSVAPELDVVTFGSNCFNCYGRMFYGCTSLTTAPELPATTLANSCYIAMFSGCTSLTVAPELPATTLAESCYNSMFSSCTSLVVAPELPATTLANSCYMAMFSGCTSLTVAPELPATTLAMSCYDSMFSSCTSLAVAPELPATTLVSACYRQMFSDCRSLSSTPALPATTLAAQCYYQMFLNCGNLTSCLSVLPATVLALSCYYKMFSSCTSLTVAPELPATTLANQCYYGMFSGCTNLTSAPELPATTLADYCYYNMFGECTRLVSAPVLPVTILAPWCYASMFTNCSNLTSGPELPATTLANRCYYGMFSGCTNLTSVPELPATSLAEACYYRMFYGCTSLTAAPELPATTLASSCYYNMFYGCNNLSHVKCLATDISASNCLANWLYTVKSTGTFVKHPDMTSWPTGTSGIPSGWTVEDAVL